MRKREREKRGDRKVSIFTECQEETMALFRSVHTPSLHCVEVANKCEVLKNIFYQNK